MSENEQNLIEGPNLVSVSQEEVNDLYKKQGINLSEFKREEEIKAAEKADFGPSPVDENFNLKPTEKRSFFSRFKKDSSNQKTLGSSQDLYGATLEPKLQEKPFIPVEEKLEEYFGKSEYPKNVGVYIPTPDTSGNQASNQRAAEAIRQDRERILKSTPKNIREVVVKYDLSEDVWKRMLDQHLSIDDAIAYGGLLASLRETANQSHGNVQAPANWQEEPIVISSRPNNKAEKIFSKVSNMFKSPSQAA